MDPMTAKIGMVVGILALIAYFVIAQPSPDDFTGAVEFFKANFAKICFVACVIGQVYAFLTKNPLRFLIFSGSLVVTWVLGW